MASDYGDLCRDIRDGRRDARAKHGRPCPECVEKLPKAPASILLPGQRCNIHGYRDPRPRTAQTSYLQPANGWRFPDVVCSQCGQGFGPGDMGFSHCKDHALLKPTS